MVISGESNGELWDGWSCVSFEHVGSRFEGVHSSDVSCCVSF